MIDQKPLDLITAEDIHDLVKYEVRESRTLEFKLKLPDDPDKDKFELCADVTSLANAAGGTLVYGVAESSGVASKVVGLPDGDADRTERELRTLWQAWIQPRLPPPAYRIIPIGEDRSVLVYRVPKSWAGPHLVLRNENLYGFAREYRASHRTGGGKVSMDATELRHAFAASEERPRQIRQWRDDRITAIMQGRTPVPVVDGPLMVLHLVPLDAFEQPYRLSASDMKPKHNVLTPSEEFATLLGTSSHGYNNADGRLCHEGGGEENRGYCQVFRTGMIEAAMSLDDENGKVSCEAFQKFGLEGSERYLCALAARDVHPPMFLMLSLLKSQDKEMNTKTGAAWPFLKPLDRDILVLPEIHIDEPAPDLSEILKPAFEVLYNAFGGELPSSSTT